MTNPMHISTVMAEYLAELEATCAGNNPTPTGSNQRTGQNSIKLHQNSSNNDNEVCQEQPAELDATTNKLDAPQMEQNHA